MLYTLILCFINIKGKCIISFIIYNFKIQFIIEILLIEYTYFMCIIYYINKKLCFCCYA